MVSVNGLTVSFGGSELFEEVSFLINEKDRIGLTGKNGAGKSTLLRILAGEQGHDAGTIAKPNGFTIGYLPQEMKHEKGRNVMEETALAFKEIKQLEQNIVKMEHDIGSRTDYESEDYHQLIHRLSETNERFQQIGGYTYKGDIEKVLMGLGFNRTDFIRLTDEFSGGWRMRIELAKILLQRPDLLLLDEPTNHLDIESIQWLEEFLSTYPGAIVLVSHDKTFLDNLTQRTIEISLGSIYDYKANYSKYLELRKERKEQQQAAAKNQEKYIEQTQQLIDKYRYKATKASFAQSLIKKLDKLDRIEVDEDDSTAIRFRFPPAERSGKVILKTEGVTKNFGEKQVLKGIDIEIERGDKVAFVGKNGEGKSTFSKIIVGEHQLNDGCLELGHNVKIGYYAQNQSDYLDGELTVFETIDKVAVGDIRKQVRSLLGAFLFSGETVDKKVKVLSGGEKARLALCKLLLFPYNVLVLDEPTNHLDMRSKDVLKNALSDFDGTVLVVSHDRDFLGGLTNKVFEFSNGKTKQYAGDVNSFLADKKLQHLNDLENIQKSKTEDTTAVSAEGKLNYEQKKELEREQRKVQNQIKKCEEEIFRLEQEIAKMDETLADPEKYKDAVKDPSTFTKYEELKKQLKAEMEKWEELISL